MYKTTQLLQYCSVLAALCFVSVLNLPLLATVDVMLSSLCCFAIIVLIDDPQGPPPATPGPVPCVPDSQSAALKRTLQVDQDVDPKPQAAKLCRADRTDRGAST